MKLAQTCLWLALALYHIARALLLRLAESLGFPLALYQERFELGGHLTLSAEHTALVDQERGDLYVTPNEAGG